MMGTASTLRRRGTRTCCPRTGCTPARPATTASWRRRGTGSCPAAITRRWPRAWPRFAWSLLPQGAVCIDSGCGEGYYTAQIAEALFRRRACAAHGGIDISKNCLRWAAKREHRVEFAVASAYALPFADSAADLLLNCFSPLALAEFRRVLKPGGAFLYVVPGARHLWELKQILYEKPYLNEEQPSPYEGFRYLDILNVEGAASLPSQEVIHDLFAMTPLLLENAEGGRERLASISQLDVTTSFRIHLFQKAGT